MPVYACRDGISMGTMYRKCYDYGGACVIFVKDEVKHVCDTIHCKPRAAGQACVLHMNVAFPLSVTRASSAAQIFGGFVTDPPHLTEEKHVGTGECFLFTLYPYVGCSAGAGRVRVNGRRDWFA
jgi:hypothetical protein